MKVVFSLEGFITGIYKGFYDFLCQVNSGSSELL